MDPAVLHLELDEGHDQDDDEDDPGNGRAVANLKVAETGLPEIVDHGHGRRDERLIVTVKNVNRFKNLQRVNKADDQVVEDIGGEEWKGDFPEALPTIRTVHFGGFM